MAEGKGVLGILEKETAGMPNWIWVVVVLAGIAAAYVVPKFAGKSSGTPDTAGTISPNGLLPAGGNAPAGSIDLSSTNSLLSQLLAQEQASQKLLANLGKTPPTPGGKPPPTPGGKPPPTKPPPTKNPPPSPTNPHKYVSVTKWPDALGSLSGIASKYGISLKRIEELNPDIKNPNLIYPGQQVRVA